jgi:hypothetical protein
VRSARTQLAWAVVAASLSVGGALMFAPYQSAHFAACFAFLFAASWAGITGIVWGRTVSRWNLPATLQAMGIGAFVVILSPLMIWFSLPAGAQTPLPPSINGNCNAVGNNNSNCTTINLGPPRIPLGLYQSGQQIGRVDGVSMGADGKQVIFANPSIASGTVDFAQNIEFQDILVSCPSLGAMSRGHSAFTVGSMIGDVTCNIIGKR